MSRSIRVAALQLRATDRSDFPRSLDCTLSAVREAASEADLLVLPEATFPAYVLGDEPFDASGIAHALRTLSEIARSARTVIVAGVAAVSDGALRNRAAVIDTDGSTVGHADKLFLWHFDRRWFVPGDQLASVQTSVGKLGVLICADGRIPTIARALVDDGAEMLVMPTAWVTSGRNPAMLENVQADLLGRVRAYENRVPFAAANKCGAELGMVAYCGKSQIVNGAGEILAIAGEHAPERIETTVRLAPADPLRAPRVEVAPRTAKHERPIRIGISMDPLPVDVDRRLTMLSTDYAIGPGDEGRLPALDRTIPTAMVDDRTVLDPGGLVPYRRAGYQLVCWTTKRAGAWTERLARARALELRLYLIVFDRAAGRAFAVDPDGTIVAGTFSDFRLASFSLDPSKTRQTAVAPGTDVVDGLERVSRLTDRREKAAT